MGLGTLARKLPYSVAESWSFRSSTTQHELETTVAGSAGGGKRGRLSTKGLALSQVGVVLGIEEANSEAADEALNVAVLCIEEQHRSWLPDGARAPEMRPVRIEM